VNRSRNGYAFIDVKMNGTDFYFYTFLPTKLLNSRHWRKIALNIFRAIFVSEQRLEQVNKGGPSSGQIPPSGGQSALNDAATASVEQRVRGPAGVPLSSDWSCVDLCVANLVPIDSHHQRARTSANLPPRGATVRPDN
jgi:hypothetical protein